MEYEQLLDLVKKRRSIRRFKPDPLPNEVVDKIIEVARWAPSGFNMQPWEYVVVNDTDLRDQITTFMNTYWQQCLELEESREDWQGLKWKLTGLKSAEQDYKIAPVFIILYGDPRTQLGLPMGVRYMPHRTDIIHTASLGNAFLYMHLAAASLGLASQWVSAIQVPYVNCKTKELLNIPQHMEVFDMMALGYPAIKAREKFVRKRDEMIHYNICDGDEFRTDEEVKSFVRKARSWTMGTHRRKADQE